MSGIIRPRNITELTEYIRVTSPADRHFLAGGTDWLIKHHEKLPEDAAVIDLSLLRELRGTGAAEGSLFVGAMETMNSISSNNAVRSLATALADAASVMGSPQIRNRATVGGNLANSSPAADTPSALAALEAEVIVFSPGGERFASVEDILSAPNKNTLSDDEIIKGFRIPVKEERISAFKKIGSRTEVSIARLNMAASVRCVGGQFYEPLVYIGTLGLAAKRCRSAENALALAPEKRHDALLSALASFVEEAIPGRATLPYKKSAIQALGEDVLAMLEERAAKGGASA